MCPLTQAAPNVGAAKSSVQKLMKQNPLQAQQPKKSTLSDRVSIVKVSASFIWGLALNARGNM